MEVERFNYFRKDSDCKNICNTNIYVSSQFNLCAKRYRDRGPCGFRPFDFHPI